MKTLIMKEQRLSMLLPLSFALKGNTSVLGSQNISEHKRAVPYHTQQGSKSLRLFIFQHLGNWDNTHKILTILLSITSKLANIFAIIDRY